MTLRVVGAGLGRTGTHSLKLALEALLGEPCYHMVEAFEHPEHVPVWERATAGDYPDWRDFLGGYAAAVDWPVAAFWRELSEANPDAIILLSTRPVDEWWRSASRTIFVPHGPAADRGETSWIDELLTVRFTPGWRDEAEAKAAYAAHNEDVRRTADPRRLVDYPTGGGWEPLCRALGVPVPATPFPHVNTTEEFRASAGLDRRRSR